MRKGKIMEAVFNQYKNEVKYFCRNLREVINNMDLVHSPEDLENDLWVVLLDTIKNKRKQVNPLFIREIFYSYLVDRLRKAKIKNKNSDLKKKDYIGKDCIGDMSFSGDGDIVYSNENIRDGLFSCTIDSPDDVLYGDELMTLISSWYLKQDEKTQNFVRELVNPSLSTVERFDEMMSNRPLRKGKKGTPYPYAIAKILGIKFYEYRKAYWGLKKFLVTNGYCLKTKKDN